MPDTGGTLDQSHILTETITYLHALEDPYRAKQLGSLQALAHLI